MDRLRRAGTAPDARSRRDLDHQSGKQRAGNEYRYSSQLPVSIRTDHDRRARRFVRNGARYRLGLAERQAGIAGAAAAAVEADAMENLPQRGRDAAGTSR